MGHRAMVDTGIALEETVEKVLNSSRRRRHRTDILNSIEQEIQKLSQGNRVEGSDISLWRVLNAKFKNKFTTSSTWNVIRLSKPRVQWYKGCGLPTQLISFLIWLAIHNRLSTGDRMKKRNSEMSTKCICCDNIEEKRNHLFFSCRYSAEIWKNLTKRLLSHHYSTDCNSLMTLICSSDLPHTNIFLLRYAFQATLYLIWHERNARRHGELASPANRLIKPIDKNVRNRLSSIRDLGEQRYATGLQV